MLPFPLRPSERQRPLLPRRLIFPKRVTAFLGGFLGVWRGISTTDSAGVLVFFCLLAGLPLIVWSVAHVWLFPSKPW